MNLEELREKSQKSRLRKLRTVTVKLVERLNHTKVGASQAIVLLTLLHNGELEPAQIADKTFIPRQTMTVILDRLEMLKLVERCNHSFDRRRKVVKLTGDGVVMASEVAEDILNFEDDIFSAITAEELALLDVISDKILAKMEEK